MKFQIILCNIDFINYNRNLWWHNAKGCLVWVIYVKKKQKNVGTFASAVETSDIVMMSWKLYSTCDA